VSAQQPVAPDLKKDYEHVTMIHAMEIRKKLPNVIKRLAQIQPTPENGVTGQNTVRARLHVVRVQESGQEHVKEKESEEAFINRQSAE